MAMTGEIGTVGTMRLGGRFRLEERVSAAGRGSVWKATDELLGRPVTVHTLPRGAEVPADMIEALRAAARVSDPRLATIYDTDLSIEDPYIVSEWTPGTHLEDLVLSGLPSPALAAAMVADAADALAVAHAAGRPHLCLGPRSLRWNNASGLKITGLGIDAALSRASAEDAGAADTAALARMLYALLTGFWPGDEATAIPPALRHGGRMYTPRQVRAGVPGVLDRDHLPRPAAFTAGRAAARAHPGRAGRGPALGGAAFLPGLRGAGTGNLRPGGGAGGHVPAPGPAREDPRAHHAATPGDVASRRGHGRGEQRAEPGPGPGPAAAWAAAGRCPCRSAARTAARTRSAGSPSAPAWAAR